MSERKKRKAQQTQKCPTCGAEPGERCGDLVRSRSGRKRWSPHLDRIALLDEVADE